MSTLDVARAIVSLQSTFPRFGMGMLWAWEIEINILKFAYLKVVSPRLNSERLRHLLDILDKITADDILVVLSLANICGKECDRLLTRCIENIVRLVYVVRQFVMVRLLLRLFLVLANNCPGLDDAHMAWVRHTTLAEQVQFPPLLEHAEGSSSETKNEVGCRLSTYHIIVISFLLGAVFAVAI
ncbi:hypothetical protein RHMOL_Rhmol08G0187900 [Rhododendron molle]|uniref:Uncharacterized protein n=1 Tax=Rhododendron molle TaxID=49168 RepID=A0ACC0MRW6_RHOML|nr:hypothetical protein RHMOL_Rhmol08G0187900 [Rhododendron molle]